MATPFINKCKDCGKDMVIASGSKGKHFCNDCLRAHQKVLVYRNYQRKKEMRAEIKAPKKYCVSCGVELEADARKTTRKYCIECSIVANRQSAVRYQQKKKTAAVKVAAAPDPPPVSPTECTRRDCNYYNKYFYCCDYREIMGLGRGCKPSACDKYEQTIVAQLQNWMQYPSKRIESYLPDENAEPSVAVGIPYKYVVED